jgi:hypothetical protein
MIVIKMQISSFKKQDSNKVMLSYPQNVVENNT